MEMLLYFAGGIVVAWMIIVATVNLFMIRRMRAQHRTKMRVMHTQNLRSLGYSHDDAVDMAKAKYP